MPGDLHLHSNASDGFFSPSDVAIRAAEAGLDFISLTDHNTTVGLAPAARALEGSHVRIISGIELGCRTSNDTELHILGYGFAPENPCLQKLAGEARHCKIEQLSRIIERLRNHSIRIDWEELPAPKEGCSVGRPVLARLLVTKGFARSVQEAFLRYLGADGSAYVPLEGFGPRECVRAIHDSGGLAVLAHPKTEELDEWIEQLVADGLDGIEVYRPRADGNEELYREMVARHFGLIASGGSDWHGAPGEDALGTFTVSADDVKALFSAIGEV